MPQVTPTTPTHELMRVRRHPERGTRDATTIESIVDAGMVCHLGFLHDERCVVIPTLYGRDGDHLVLHGSAAARSLRAGAQGLPVCVTVTVVDGLVLARSAFHHSANYRSVVVHGEAQLVADDDAKLAALEALTDHVTPGRWAQVRRPTAKELKATTVLTLSLEHAVAKVREGGVSDDAADMDLPVWAGVVPMATTFGAPEGDGPGVASFEAPDWTGAAGSPVAPIAVATSMSTATDRDQGAVNR